MKIVVGNLPDGAGQEDVEKLVQEYAKVKSVALLDEAESGGNEYLVTLEDETRVTADAIVDKLDSRLWKDVQITARVLLHQDDTDSQET